jgi:hypothetical protein
VQVNFAAGKAEMHVRNLAELDYPNLPISVSSLWQTAFIPATISFDVVWNGPVTRRINAKDGSNGNQFAGEFLENEATVTWSASNATGFVFRSNPGNFGTSVIAFAELGHERNGIFFESASLATPANSQSRALFQTALVAPPAVPQSNSGLPAARSPAGNDVLPVMPAGTTSATQTNPAMAPANAAVDQIFASVGKAGMPFFSVGRSSRTHEPAAVGDLDVLATEIWSMDRA